MEYDILEGLMHINLRGFRKHWLEIFGLLFPYSLFFIAIIGIISTIVIKRPDLTVRSLYLVIPLIFTGIILLKKIPIEAKKNIFAFGYLKFSHLLCAYAIFFAASIVILFLSKSRPLVYFIIAALIPGVILAQILYRNSFSKSKLGLILFEIILYSLSLIWGIALKYPLYFGDTDLLYHMYYIKTIIETGHIGLISVDYQNFPLYHILIAVGTKLTDLFFKYTLFIIIGFSWQIGIIFAYLVFNRICNSKQLSLLSCLLFATSPYFIFYGSEAITRSLAFVLFMFLMYLITYKHAKFVFLAFIIMWALILTHHISTLFIIAIFFMIYVIQKSVFGGSQESSNIISLPFVLLIIVCFFSYLIWVAYLLMESTLPSWLNALISNDILIKSETRPGNEITFLLTNSYYPFAIFLALLGIGSVLKVNKKRDSNLGIMVVALTSLIFMLLYVPGPLNLFPQADIALIYRFSLLVLPFIALMMAYGLKYLINSNRFFGLIETGQKSLIYLVLLFVVAISFFSMISGENARDCPYFPHVSTSASNYFNRAELESFYFINQNGNKFLTLYGDYFTVRNQYSLSGFTSRRVIKGGDISYMNHGYLILRIGEFNRRRCLLFSPHGSTSIIYRYKKQILNSKANIITNLIFKNKIYCNGDVDISLI